MQPANRVCVIGLLLACGLACGRDLAVPQTLPPVLASVSPSAAFAGEVVVLSGSNLGNQASASVLIGGLVASAAPPDAALPAGALAVLMPTGLSVGSQDVIVTTPAGRTPPGTSIRFLGAGHLRSLAVGASQPLGVLTSFVAVTSSTDDGAFLLDSRHGEVVWIDGRSGRPRNPDDDSSTSPVAVGQEPVLAVASSTTLWVYSLGLPGDVPQLRRFDFSQAEPTFTCGPVALPEIDGSADPISGHHPSLLAAGAVSADRSQLFLPTGRCSVLSVDLRTCPPGLLEVPISYPGAPSDEAVLGVAFAGQDLIVAFLWRFVRLVLADGSLAVGQRLPAPDTPDFKASLAVQPGADRLAYMRYDGNVGFVTWGSATGSPEQEATTLYAYSNVSALGWAAPAPGEALSDRLVAQDTGAAFVYHSTASGTALLASVKLSADQPFTTDLPSGEILLSDTGGTALLSRDGVLLRSGAIGVQLGSPDVEATAKTGYYAAMAPDGWAIVSTLLGMEFLSPDFTVATSSAEGALAQRLDGVSSYSGQPVGWRGDRVFVYETSTKRFVPLGGLGDDRIVDEAAQDVSGSIVAATAQAAAGTSTYLEVQQGSGWKELELPGTDRARLVIGGGIVWLQRSSRSPTGTLSLSISQVDPAAPAIDPHPIALKIPPASSSSSAMKPLVPFWSRSLGAVLVPVFENEGSSFYSKPLAGFLYAVRADGSVSGPVRLPAALLYLLAVSPDGRMLVSSNYAGGIDTALVSWPRDGALQLAWSGHLDLAGVADGNFSLDGERFLVDFVDVDEAVMVE
jgi:hypothetical protein